MHLRNDPPVCKYARIGHSQRMCDEISANALICVLQNSHRDLYRALFDQDSAQKLVIVPVAHSLINVHISRDFIECHILRETEVPNVFLNLHGQAVEVTKEKVTTSFGFKNHIAADIVRDDKIHDLGGVVRACLTNDYLMHATPSCKDIFDLNLNDAQEIVDSWCQSSPGFKEFIYGAMDRIKTKFVMVPGYENELCSILCSYVEKAISIYLANKNDEIQCSRDVMCQVTLNFAFTRLYDDIMAHLRDTYRKQEDIIQNRLLKLRKEMNLNSTLNLFDLKRQVSNYNLIPSCEALKMMAETQSPHEKFKHLAKSIQFNKPESNDESVSFFILTMVAGGLPDSLANYAFLDMYAGAKFTKHKIVTQHLETFRGGLQFLLD